MERGWDYLFSAKQEDVPMAVRTAMDDLLEQAVETGQVPGVPSHWARAFLTSGGSQNVMRQAPCPRLMGTTPASMTP